MAQNTTSGSVLSAVPRPHPVVSAHKFKFPVWRVATHHALSTIKDEVPAVQHRHAVRGGQAKGNGFPRPQVHDPTVTLNLEHSGRHVAQDLAPSI